ncbi:MAG: thioesterase family protein [Pseudomonadota bacterium]
MKPAPPVRADYRAFHRITTRWMDNDVYGHVNNVVYYSFFDTVVNGHLVEAGVLDFEAGTTIGLVVETTCSYFAPIAFPDAVTGGLRVDRIGTSSVQYGVGIFRGDEDNAAAAGHFVHVYVGRETRRPVPIPDDLRAVLEAVKA